MTVMVALMVAAGSYGDDGNNDCDDRRRQLDTAVAKFPTRSAAIKLQPQIYNCSKVQLKVPNPRSREKGSICLFFFFSLFVYLFLLSPISIFLC